jgi:hypothetical protein
MLDIFDIVKFLTNQLPQVGLKYVFKLLKKDL